VSLTVVSPGMLTLIQDAGRAGFGSSGVGRSGAFDRAALRQANVLVGNPAGAPALEVLAGGLYLRASRAHVLAVTGAVGTVLVDGHPVKHGRPVVLLPDQHVQLGTFDVGLRAYLAVAGGVLADQVLGSASTDTLSGLGPAPVPAGAKLHCGLPTGQPLDGTDVPALIASGSTTVDVLLGPRDDWFTAAALARLCGSAWTVTPTSNRIGIRLDGPELERALDGELPSEPCVFGSIQVTSAGLPVVLGPDHPVTGGYPVIAVVADGHLDRLAQLRPGETLRFRRS
jgi:biotin-dependent carboxylase-like uncharacterized protein